MLYQQKFTIIRMSARLKWSEEQLELLRAQGGSMNKNKWTKIAKEINKRWPNLHKTPKQCREKYNNYLIFGVQAAETDWTSIQHEVLFREYKEKGPKWKIISKYFPNRSQNTIKNKFYGNVRKVVRRFNKIGKSNEIRTLKPIKEKSIIRIIQPQTGASLAPLDMQTWMNDLRLRLLDLIQKGFPQNWEAAPQKDNLVLQIINECRFLISRGHKRSICNTTSQQLVYSEEASLCKQKSRSASIHNEEFCSQRNNLLTILSDQNQFESSKSFLPKTIAIQPKSSEQSLINNQLIETGNNNKMKPESMLTIMHRCLIQYCKKHNMPDFQLV